MSTISCTFEEFKQMAKEFRQVAHTLDIDQLHNAWKCLGLGYLGMHEDMWQESAAIVLKIEARTFMQCEEVLLMKGEGDG